MRVRVCLRERDRERERERERESMHVSACVRVCVCVCVCVRVRASVRACLCVYMRACICACVRVTEQEPTQKFIFAQQADLLRSMVRQSVDAVLMRRQRNAFRSVNTRNTRLGCNNIHIMAMSITQLL